ncbi:MAG TPA: GDSL-type esterase/lipase family protein [Planctomycetota bacterium]|nr:GDSL-type esterase/lipase family protein [Planctomycetota bacterium]
MRSIGLLLLTTALGAVDSQPIDSMDSVSFKPLNDQVQIASVDGKQGKAIQFTVNANGQNAFGVGSVKGQPGWDQAAGISFWVKGDGSQNLGGLQFVWNDDYAQRYDVAFPISSTEWTKISIPWSDFIPVLANADSKPLDPTGDRQPSKLGNPWFGKWWYWREYPATSYAIDDLRLENEIAVDTKDYTPRGAPLARTLAKLKAGKPLTVVTMGDSLTDFRHWANKEQNWPGMFVASVKAAMKSDVTIVNPAIGGTELRQNLVLIPRWLATTPKPDLVVICFGGNDYASGMRQAMFTQAMGDAIRRVRRVTGGAADVLVVTTVPNVEQWDALGELAEACRVAAKAENAGLADAFAAFHEAGKDDPASLFAHDKVHLGPAGHAVFAKTVLAAIEAQGAK